jgi:hypothetical protein
MKGKAKLQWLQDPRKLNIDNLNDIRQEASMHFRNRKTEYLKDIINEFAVKCKNNNIRDLDRGTN